MFRPSYHREFALLVQKIVHVWNGFFKGQVLIGFAIGVLTFVQFSAMGISNTFILAVMTGTISLIPTIGGIIALVPLSLIPLIQGSQASRKFRTAIMALLVVGINLLITQIIWNVIAPKILGDALDLPLPVIIVGVFIGAAAGGVLGAFLVAPIMATIRVAGRLRLAQNQHGRPLPRTRKRRSGGAKTHSSIGDVCAAPSKYHRLYAHRNRNFGHGVPCPSLLSPNPGFIDRSLDFR